MLKFEQVGMPHFITQKLIWYIKIKNQHRKHMTYYLLCW